MKLFSYAFCASTLLAEQQEEHLACKKTEWWDAGVGQGADLNTAQLKPMPLTISCSSKSRLVLPSWFLADRTIGQAFGTLCRLSVCLSVVCDVLYCGKTVRPSEKLSQGVNRKPGSKS